MKFIHRLGYYLGGFAIGLVILSFFLSGKEARCDYSPNARTTKYLSGLPKSYSDNAEAFMTKRDIDTSTVKQLIRYGKVDFGKSDTKGNPCKTYHLNSVYKGSKVQLTVENCNEKAHIVSIGDRPK
ncbi:DUF4258 domain-containing protein [Paucihalobacter ruber]|uniref:DUF4258 domain-containing protein n=1 Tax=Paucihalobacter ruber TaxID=2567861 RepID=A0A506PD54_9FLAO|nr:DUF4258 domain-containing protein [Paucihalobacter ruber]TPV31519.1 DUF4258 domain-containing protein [Paucihalobacter ruber]